MDPKALGQFLMQPSTADVLNTPVRRGGILPVTEYPNRTEFDLSSGLTGALWNALTAPARAARGEISEADMIPEAFNFAGSLTLGSLLAPRPQNAVGMFGGKLSSKNPEPFIDDAVQGFKLTDDLIGRVKSQRQSDETPFLYHSGTSADAGNIRAGLEPQHGKWIQEIASGATDDISSLLSNSPELAWLSDAPDWVIAKVRRATGRHAVTADDVQKHGHLSIFKPDEYDDVFRVGDGGIDGPDTLLKRLSGEDVKLWDTPIYKTDDMGHWESPFGVERNEWITTDTLLPEATLTGDELLRFLDSMTPAWRSELAANAKTGAAVPLATKALEAQQPQGIRAFHGSPHDFDRFSMDAIGTGEGAQAYGHGLYFAEAEDVAKSYRDALSGMNFNGQHLTTGDTDWHIMDAARKAAPISQRDADFISTNITDSIRGGFDLNKLRSDLLAQRDGNNDFTTALDAALDVASNATKHPGHMYEVNIKANPEDFLDWDKPLSQQSEKVRNAVLGSGMAKTPFGSLETVKRSLARERGILQEAEQELASNRGMFGRSKLSADQRDAYARQIEDSKARIDEFERILAGDATASYLVPQGGDTAAQFSSALREAGISGIRYLDQMSRGAGEGSSNYVVFDDNLIEILRKYGLLGPVAGGGTLAGMLMGGQDGETY